MTPEQIQENSDEFKYLFELQKSGVTNMLGGGTYLQKMFGMDKNKSKEILLAWMHGYEQIAKELAVEI